MTEGHDILWCKVCHDRQSFLMSGSHTKGICLKCGNEVRGKERIKRLQDALAFDFIFATLSNGIDK